MRLRASLISFFSHSSMSSDSSSRRRPSRAGPGRAGESDSRRPARRRCRARCAAAARCRASGRPAACPRGVGESQVRPAVLAAEVVEEEIDQQADVVAPVAQRRQVQLEHAEPIVQVFAELASRARRSAGPDSWRRSPARRRSLPASRRPARNGCPSRIRSSLAWPSSVSSPTSSRNSVPRSAC